mmetsp:Transcript_74963/g.223359  ORF Transcript_74963/g.223359 Transcript_74963/m.223359 type:complete len:320 (-) Transcript_74963:67-1026(-)
MRRLLQRTTRLRREHAGYARLAAPPEQQTPRRSALLGAAAATVATAWGLEALRREPACRCESRAVSPTVHLWFIRHGETENNVLLRQLGSEGPEYERVRSSDPLLSALGREQVQKVTRHPALAKLFGKGKPPVDIYSSPLLRAIETAAPLQRALPGSPPIRVRPELAEIGGLRRVLEDGSVEVLPGMSPQELRERFPDLELELTEVPSQGWWSESAAEDKSESGRRAIRDRVVRVARWARDVKPSAPDGRHVVIIGHGALLNRLLVEMLGAPHGSCSFAHGNTAVTHLELRGSVVYVHCVNWMPTSARQSSSAMSTSVT